MNKKINFILAISIILLCVFLVSAFSLVYSYFGISFEPEISESPQSLAEDYELNIKDIENTAYPIYMKDDLVPFKNGEIFGWAELDDSGIVYHYWEDKGINNGWNFEARVEKVSFGDLNNDSKNDAAVILSSWSGGTGVFKSLVIFLNKNNKPVYLNSVNLGDRTVISSLSIDSNIIKINVLTHGPGDGMCCPSKEETWNYELSGNVLNKIKEDYQKNKPEPDKTENSNNNIRIGIPSPNQGDIWKAGEVYKIAWFSDKLSVSDRLNLILLDTKIDTYYVIARNIPTIYNAGSSIVSKYNWTIPKTGLNFSNEKDNNFKIYIGEYSPSSQTGSWEAISYDVEQATFGYGNNFNIVFPNAPPIIDKISTGGTHAEFAAVSQGESTLIAFYGHNLTGLSKRPNCGINLSSLDGIKIKLCNANSPSNMSVLIDVDESATPGEREINITNEDGISNSLTLIVLSSSVSRGITVISPNGGEAWKKGEVHRIKWDSQGLDKVKIFIYNDTVTGSGSVNYLDSARESLSVSASQGYFDWIIVSNILPRISANDEGRYKIKITDVYGLGIGDESDDYFSILTPSPGSCSDSDNGLNFYVKGKVIYNSNSYDDYCADDGSVVEYYCPTNYSPPYAANKSCEVGCENGACISTP